MKNLIAPTLLACLLAAPAAWAHAPTFDAPGYDSPDTPFEVDDPAVSIVLYRNVTCEQPELWMELQGEAGFPLYVQLLVPRIERLADYRPSVAVVGPGLPEVDLGIDLPEGMGAVEFDTADIVEPEVFYEPFTQTEDYMLVEETVPLPESGTYYVVAWDPEGQTGKLAVAVGTIESFGPEAFFLLPQWTENTRTFHETPDYPPPGPVEEAYCAVAAEEAPPSELDAVADDDPGDTVSMGGGDAPMMGDGEAPTTDGEPAAPPGGELAADEGDAPSGTGSSTSGDSGGCSTVPLGRSRTSGLALAAGLALLGLGRRRRQRTQSPPAEMPGAIS